jgi:hypothetical protein
MNNSFIDEGTGIPFIIPFHRQLTPEEAALVARKVIERKKDALLDVWKRRPENKGWEGDEEEKKEELFANATRQRMTSSFSARTLKKFSQKGVEGSTLTWAL